MSKTVHVILQRDVAKLGKGGEVDGERRTLKLHPTWAIEYLPTN